MGNTTSRRSRGQGGKEPTYSWAMFPDGFLICYHDSDPQQTITKLWETGELTEFHDAPLAQATKEINAILRRVEENNRDPDRKLSFIQFENRHLLVWARYGAIGADDPDDAVIDALKIKKGK